ncbi:MAG: hypothetical protein IE920_07320 [Thiotrichales bacterium]|nr:hypothetical protein [Thiotrichales bacterium]
MRPFRLHVQLTTLLLLLFSLLGATNALAAEQSTAELSELNDQALHIKLVETALRYDFYNKRCRGISVSKEVNEVNRLFLKKYGLTVHNFIKQQMQTDPRDYQEQLKQALYAELAKMGGCDASKEQGMIARFQADFRLLLKRAENSNWFPE